MALEFMTYSNSRLLRKGRIGGLVRVESSQKKLAGIDMRILIAGVNGQLGQELTKQAEEQRFEVVGYDLPEFDITQKDMTEDVLERERVSAVINVAAYNAVDRAENEVEKAFAVNRDGAGNLARACRRLELSLIHFSTDYVFDGRKERPYIESDSVAPLGVYGQSKAAGEAEIRKILEKHIIVRTSWLYGSHGSNFLKTILRLAKEREVIRVVSDQQGCPTATKDLAEVVLTLASVQEGNQHWGTFHYSGSGVTSWYAFAGDIVRLANRYDSYKARVEPITTEDYPALASRPRYSALDCSRIEQSFGVRSRPWRVSLSETIASLLG
jgi:dTDP-4-dehydrorhamnose reductase